MIYLGIDPGLEGACALYDTETRHIVVQDLPTIQKTVQVAGTKRKRRILNLPAIANWLDLWVPASAHAIIEDVHAMPRQGVTSSFKFGFVCGAMHGILVAYRLPITPVTPHQWKASFGLTSDKHHARRKATELFPAYAHLWARAQDDGRAEAVLLAYWGAHR